MECMFVRLLGLNYVLLVLLCKSIWLGLYKKKTLSDPTRQRFMFLKWQSCRSELQHMVTYHSIAGLYKGLGGIIAGWKTLSRQDMEGKSVWLCASHYKCVLVCVHLGLMPRLGGTWPYVEARRPSLLVSVRCWRGYGRSSHFIHLLIPCLSVALHTAWCGWGVKETLQLTAPLVSRQKACERERRINTSKRIQRSEMTGIAYFWRLVNHDWACVCVCVCLYKSVCVSVCLSPNKEFCLWEDINSV